MVLFVKIVYSCMLLSIFAKISILDVGLGSEHFSALCKRSPSEVFLGKGVLLESLFIEQRLQHKCFLVNIVIFLRTSVLKNICEELLLFLVVVLVPIKETFSFYLSIQKSYLGIFLEKLS